MKIMSKKELFALAQGGTLYVGPIPEGDHITLACIPSEARAYAVKFYSKPIVSDNQQYPVIVGTYWATDQEYNDDN